MEALEKKLIGALIGMARATDGNEHLISLSSTAVAVAALTATSPEHMQQLLGRVEDEKRKMVPDCFKCANPCGRTAAYNLDRLEQVDSEVRELKLRLLSGVRRIAASAPEVRKQAESLIYMGLVVIGMEDYTAEDLKTVLTQINEAIKA